MVSGLSLHRHRLLVSRELPWFCREMPSADQSAFHSCGSRADPAERGPGILVDDSPQVKK